LGCRTFLYGEARDVVHAVFEHVDDAQTGMIFSLMGGMKLYNRPDLDEQLRRMDPVVTKLIFYVDPKTSGDTVRRVRELLGSGYEVSRSCPKILEVMTAASGKGNGIRMVADILEGRVRKIVCAGDYENDITMLQAADIGYAVENAVPCVKAVADRVTVHCRQHALAAIVRDLEADVARGL
jgi:hydroxymethylpyrimidine pyrophosphatase-like HAD family hydrolase